LGETSVQSMAWTLVSPRPDLGLTLAASTARGWNWADSCRRSGRRLA
jgi:hypothetical protein